ncbi:MAG: hypothetical protein IPK79_08680 [Vampirovibrionales bacterium]|nr:hypothetical protein [Vampirovibrionales bacterium]
MSAVKRRLPQLSEAAIFGFERISASTLSVAQENYQASLPPIRTLNVTGEILKLIRSHALKASIHSALQEPSPLAKRRIAPSGALGARR